MRVREIPDEYFEFDGRFGFCCSIPLLANPRGITPMRKERHEANIAVSVILPRSRGDSRRYGSSRSWSSSDFCADVILRSRDVLIDALIDKRAGPCLPYQAPGPKLPR